MSFPAATSPFQAALAWALVHSLWQAGAGALALEAVLAAMPARIGRSGARHQAAAAALVACALLPLVTLTWLLAARSGGAGAAAGVLFSTGSGAVRTGGGAAGGATLGARAVMLVSAALPWLLPLWAAATALALLRLAGGAVWARRLVTRSHPAPVALTARTRALAAALHVDRQVRLAVSDRPASPAVIGGVRPTIVLPARALDTLSAAELDGVLVHELTHVARHDDLLALLQALVDALLVLNPAARHVSRRLRGEREHRCDDAVVAAAGRIGCARILARLDELRGAAPAWTARAAGLAVAGGPLVRRIRRLAAPPPRRPRLALATALALVAVLPAGERLLAASAAALPRGLRTVIHAVDDAGPFTVALLDGRVVGATLDGRNLPAPRLQVDGDSLRFLDTHGRPAFSVRLLPGGGLTWRSRPTR